MIAQTKYDVPPINLLIFSRLILLMPCKLTRSFVYFYNRKDSLLYSQQDLTHHDMILSQIFHYFKWVFSRKTAMVSQFKFRILQLRIIKRLVTENSFNKMSLYNVVFSLLLDIVLGNLVLFLLINYTTPSYWIETTLFYTSSMMKNVFNLLKILQSMPAGLKLNRPLNMALSQFFLYHIYLWESYMTIIQPVFDIFIKMIFYSGFFGITSTIR